MTDTTRPSDGHPDPWQRPPVPATPPPPPAYQPRPPVGAAPGASGWPGGTAAAVPPPPGAGDPPAGAPPAGDPPAGDALAGDHRGGRGRRRNRRGAALLVAVAVVSAVLGGGTAALVGRAAEDSTSTAPTPVVNTGATSGGGVSAVAEAVAPSIVEIEATSGSGESTGSGVVITKDGEIITNNHVIAGADEITVRFSDGGRKTASVVGTDAGKDLALIRVSGAGDLKPATLGDSDRVRVGDQVVAIGSPEGLTGTVTSGIVSALDRDVTVSSDQERGRDRGDGSGDWPFEFGGGRYNGEVGSATTTYQAIQTDASLNPGNSGGALINMAGQVIGINSAMYTPSSGELSGRSAGSVGLGFSIPVNTVKADLAKLRAGSGD
ncbi:S1C family serine protease [Streptomyces sp. NPDC018031]|uniref:S1C family serine protease n=1 Tax=Streptomyces sp. NPDC018031 TaxID=3365033 RepID=UPI003797105D